MNMSTQCLTISFLNLIPILSLLIAICSRCKVECCGEVTHTEISYRALYKYDDLKDNVNYAQIIRENQDALEAGSGYPDAFYPGVCFDGLYHDVSEWTHWTPFVNATVHHIRANYPQPWDKDTKKLVAFLLGVVSHQVADISWHSLSNLTQGFIEVMSKINYHGVYPKAHFDADLGGEVLNIFQLNLNYSDYMNEWYVPVDDLTSIYNKFYAVGNITRGVVENCTKLLFVQRVAERIALEKYFPQTADNSPFLVDQLYEYFLGGIEDMSVWTRRIWKYVTGMLQFGTKDCLLPKSTLYIRCNDTSIYTNDDTKLRGSHSFFINPLRLGLSPSDVVTIRSGRGLKFRSTKNLKMKINNLLDSRRSNAKASKPFVKEMSIEKPDLKVKLDRADLPDGIYTVGVKYAKLGRSFAVGDLNGDGNDDLVVGSPGYYSSSNQENGMVFIVFGTDDGLDITQTDIRKVSAVQIPGPVDIHEARSQFGQTVAIVDFDKDGRLDVVVGAPTHGSSNLTYGGLVFIYSIHGTAYSLRGIVNCEQLYCTLGSTIATGDANSDLYHDLFIASPFAPGYKGVGEQRGFVQIMEADEKFKGLNHISLSVGKSSALFLGKQNFSWFGQSVDVKTFNDSSTYLAIGEPTYRKCAREDCSYDPDDIQAKGRLNLYTVKGEEITLSHQLDGHSQFEMLGAQVAMGSPYGDSTKVLAVTSSGKNAKGKIAHVPTVLTQAGSVTLYNLSSSYPIPLAVFNGDRKHGRFGATLKLVDINNDGVDDLIVGAPLRTFDYTEELAGAQEGRVYIFYGGSKFPVGDVTTNCGILHVIEPCPGEKADRELKFGENLARFGSQVAVVKSKRKTNIVVTAEHSSLGERLSGAIAIFSV